MEQGKIYDQKWKFSWHCPFNLLYSYLTKVNFILQDTSPVVALVYVVDVYRQDYSFVDADVEVTYQYKA